MLRRRGYTSADPITERNRDVLDYLRGDFIVIDCKSKSQYRNSYSRVEYLRLTSWFWSIARQLRARTSRVRVRLDGCRLTLPPYLVRVVPGH